MMRPTALKLGLTHCPMAITHYENGVPQDRDVFAAGTAAHDVLYVLGETRDHTAVDGAITRLLSEGRRGYDAEPPLPEAAVMEGRRLAERWVSQMGLPLPGKARYELGFGFTREWQPTEYGEGWFNLRQDVTAKTEAEDEEAWGCVGLKATDYKSAWNAGEAMLDSIQMRAQALSLHLRWAETGLLEHPPDFIAIEIAGLRTLQTWRREFWYDQGADEAFAEIQRDLELVINAMSRKPREAAPGIRCMGCPYRLACPAARAWMERFTPDAKDPHAVAAAYALLESGRANLAALAREVAAGGTVATPHGAVGYLPKEQSKASAGAAKAIWQAWADKAGLELPEEVTQVLHGFLAAAEFGVSQVARAAKPLSPEGTIDGGKALAHREGWLSTTVVRRFGVQRHSDEPDEDEAGPEARD